LIVFDNIIYSLQRAGGISLYWSEILKRANATENLNFLSYGASNGNIFSGSQPHALSESLLPTSVLRYTDFRKKLNANDIFHSSYYRVSNQKDIINITTLHDFTYEYYSSGFRRFIHSSQKKRSLFKSDKIICISENTKNDLLFFYPDISEEKISVVYNGVSDGFYPIEKKCVSDEVLSRPFFLFLGDRSPYKKFDLVIDALRYFKNFSLVVVGKDFTKGEIEQLYDINERVVFLGNVQENILNVLYNHAFCLLYPSLYEGFGIPILEAMKSSCPVIATMGSSINEVAASKSTLMEKCNLECLIPIVNDLEDTNFRSSVIKDGLAKSSIFSWDKCYRETLDIYNQFK
jgi:glycosyltransferase involved in cell wall biosynthesis